MIDMHSHILYDIDDGSRSRDMSLEMLRMAVACGTESIVATPHVNRKGIVPEWETICEKVASLQKDAEAENIPISIYAGAEVELNYEALAFLPEDEKKYCIAGTRYILCELTEQSEPDQTEQLLFELMLRGYRPVLAHPERFPRIMEHAKLLERWLERGVLLQCNSGSFDGYFGENAKRYVQRLAERNMISLLGSDGHRTEVRTTDMSQARAAIEAMPWGKDLWNLCEINGRKVLDKKVIYCTPKPSTALRKKKGWLARLFGK